MMSFFRVAFLCLYGLVLGQPIQAQNKTNFRTIKGVVNDSLSGAPIGYVSLQLTARTGKTIETAFSDENGTFQLKTTVPGSYQLQVSFVGYHPKTVVFTVAETEPSIPLAPVLLAPDVNLLDEVNVSAKKRLVEQRPGMLVYHAENDPTNVGGSAADVLRKAPALQVDAEGNVTMRGSGSIRILINGKYSGQVARSPADALNMIPSDIVRSVEVITSPNAKYDAEGAAGVINIITKKNNMPFGGALTLSGGNREQILNPRAGISLEKWHVNAYAHLHRLQDKWTRSLQRSPISDQGAVYGLTQSTAADNIRPHGSYDMSVDYQPDTTTLLNLSAGSWFGNWPVNTTQTNVSLLPGSAQRYAQEVLTRGAPNIGFELNSSYTKRLRKPRQELFAIAQYSNNLKDDYDYDTWHRNDAGTPIYRERNDNHLQTAEWTLQSDYTHPLGRGGRNVLEAGVKAIFRDVLSDYTTLASETGSSPLEVQPSRTDRFDYSQHVLAGYLQTKLQLPADWLVIGGIRLEKTYVEGLLRSVGEPFTNDFTNWVPSATFEKKWNSNGTLAVSYTQRITRPSIIDLNPNIDARDANNLVVGNPDLRPQATHQTELSYGASTASGVFLFGSLYWRQSDNAIEDIIRIDPASGISTITKQNLGSSRQLGVNASANWPISSQWQLSSNARAGHARFDSRALEIANGGWNAGINANLTYSPGKQYTVQGFVDYDSRAVTLQGYETHWLYYSFSVSKDLPKQNLNISFVAANPFAAYTSRTDVWDASGYRSQLDNRYYNRSFRLTVGWKFGQSGRQVQHRGVNNDDVNTGKEQ
ncbi:outer membrane beta-barrel family protein [Parapedobacter koreensis]|uniref:Outer membrane receptor for ferrienterochelin and colicins n=1 Tax=Parapedobacter koreensis TaxID=332977 RepID=A0A1H7JWD8_9SPHI|nr:outer membrane beta-barrel family protein [Parapedobacter koreensis]SEK78576.1 Outer membrane receptor for ferrienterochelin and colicins [Parapedobacter koreensis]